MALAHELAPKSDDAVVFRADGANPHASQDYLSSGGAIWAFFEINDIDAHGRLSKRRSTASTAWHAMHDSIGSSTASSCTVALGLVGASLGLADPKLVQSMQTLQAAADRRRGGVPHRPHLSVDEAALGDLDLVRD